ncbi:S49 family peptidase [Chelativorans sp. YIM 93263]|uniref:S49 family peptidase n=1 Tax=Chelativorans sp. YIM 93263 TaxID=2906648 RepID=UPI00237826D6|nr:S49 family peptidase [Chelativorans sp. YIM 93263]
MSYPEIAARMFNTPLMLHEAKGDIIARAFGPRVLGFPEAQIDVRGGERMGLVGDDMGQWREAGDRYYQPTRYGNIAIIEIEGSLINKGKWIGKSSGQTTYEGIITQVNAVIDDSSVSGVILEIDSFGGEVTGAFDCAERLFELSQAKPTIAVLTDHACSAGYLLASAARQIVIPVNGYAGSIGVISLHVDMSKWLAKEGLAVTILKAGAHKADLNPYEPLPEDVLERELADLEAIRVEFAETVARYRGARLTKDAALATEADVFRGQAAVDAGVADVVARPSQVLAAFQEELGRKD